MSFPRFAFYALWVAPALLMALLAFLMQRRHLHREVPAFFAYAVFTAARTPILFFIFHRHNEIYAYAYWIAEGLSAALGLAAIYEVFRRLFQAYEATSRLGNLLFRWTAAGFVLLAVVAASLAQESDLNRLVAGVLAVTQGVRLVQCGLLLFLFSFCFFSGLSWRNHLFGIATGFGLFAGVQLATAAMQLRLGINQQTWVWVNMASYNCAVLVWVSYLLAPQRAEDTVVPVPVAAEAKGWNQALLQLLQR